mmetsp:Transcript_19102/g.32575  ORF Transcript_19102/g.32575 Transcript_19102/m.32575 type:complete len:87 (-) Transcript_19102:223-483(-)
MDLNMPVLDGFDSTSKILEFQNQRVNLDRLAQPQKDIPNVKVIALTAYVNNKNVERCNEVGMTKVMNKPAESKYINLEILTHCPFL